MLRSQALEEGLELVVPIHATYVSDENEGRLVHVTGRVEVSDVSLLSLWMISFPD